MTNNCKDCFWYTSGMLISTCCHVNSVIVPEWYKYYEGKDCPNFENRDEKFNDIKKYLVEMIPEDYGKITNKD